MNKFLTIKNGLEDGVGNEIHEGAILRWKHFSTSRKKYYMYKQAGKIEGKKTQFFHLPLEPSKCDSRTHEGFVISSMATWNDDIGVIKGCVVVHCGCGEHRHTEIKRSLEISD